MLCLPLLCCIVQKAATLQAHTRLQCCHSHRSYYLMVRVRMEGEHRRLTLKRGKERERKRNDDGGGVEDDAFQRDDTVGVRGCACSCRIRLLDVSRRPEPMSPFYKDLISMILSRLKHSCCVLLRIKKVVTLALAKLFPSWPQTQPMLYSSRPPIRELPSRFPQHLRTPEDCLSNEIACRTKSRN